MPIYEFYCQTCETKLEQLCFAPLDKVACRCGSSAIRIPSMASIVIAGNAGPKLRTRVALSDELEKQGMTAPLFSSDLGKDKARWLLKKEGIR
jgi:putative FmdB family regulatory protein